MAMKESLDTLYGMASDAAQAAARKTKQLAEIAKANLSIYAEEDKIKKAQVELGKDFYLGQVQTTFRERLAEWLQDQAFEAEDISVAHVGKLLLETDGVEDYTGLVLNGSVQNVPLSEEQIAVAGEIRLEVIV